MDARLTEILARWRSGDDRAGEQMMALVYDELRRLAAHHMKSERPGHTLQATALVHEAWVRLAGMDVDWEDRSHFLRTAARAMRRILVDHAKARGREKRSGGRRVPLEDLTVVASEPSGRVLALDDALRRLEDLDPRKARIVEWTYFGGLGQDDIARTLDVSPRTVQRDLRLARAWLRRELG